MLVGSWLGSYHVFVFLLKGIQDWRVLGWIFPFCVIFKVDAKRCAPDDSKENYHQEDAEKGRLKFFNVPWHVMMVSLDMRNEWIPTGWGPLAIQWVQCEAPQL